MKRTQTNLAPSTRVANQAPPELADAAAPWELRHVVEALASANADLPPAGMHRLGRHALPSRETLDSIVADLHHLQPGLTDDSKRTVVRSEPAG